MYPPVDPILVQLGPLSIHWYGVIMTLAIFLGALVASRFVTKHGADGNVIWDLLLWVLIPALIGARLYFVFIQSPRGPSGLGEYLAHPIEILEIWRGGIHIYGALIFGGLALLLYLWMHKLPIGRYLDGVALGITLGQAIGRLGNFINQELYGPPTTLPWGLRIDAAHRIPPYDNLILYPDSVRFQPLFLYELIWDVIGFVLLLWIARRLAKQLRSGDIFLLYLIWVPLGRFFIEFMRTDSWFFPGTPFNTAHILTATAVICGATFLFLRHRHTPAIPQVIESPSDQVHEDVQEISEPSAEPEQGQEPTVVAPKASEPAAVSQGTKVEETQETSEPTVEPEQKEPPVPVAASDAGEPAAVSQETKVEETQEASEPSAEPEQSQEPTVVAPKSSEPAAVSQETEVEETQETSEPSAEPEQKETPVPVAASDAGEPAAVSQETEVGETQETSEPTVEPEQKEPPVGTPEASKHSETSAETEGGTQKVVAVSSKANATLSNGSKTDPIGIEHP